MTAEAVCVRYATNYERVTQPRLHALSSRYEGMEHRFRMGAARMEYARQ